MQFCLIFIKHSPVLLTNEEVKKLSKEPSVTFWVKLLVAELIELLALEESFLDIPDS